MNADEFAGWLAELVDEGELEPDAAKDLLEQRHHFDREREWLPDKYDQRVVGFQDGKMLVADSVAELMARGKEQSPDRQLYFEGIGYDPFGAGR